MKKPKTRKPNCLWLARNKSNWYKAYISENPPLWDESTDNWRSSGTEISLLSYFTVDDWHRLDEQFHLPPGGGPLRVRLEAVEEVTKQ